jgi:putative transcriptional regulator
VSTKDYRRGPGTSVQIQIGLVVAFVLLEIVPHIAIAMQSPNEARAPRDERRSCISGGASEMSDCGIENCIRELRLERNEMTQQDLADRIGVTRQTVNAIELGKYSPSLEVAFRIAAVFRVPLDKVFQYTGKVRP